MTLVVSAIVCDMSTYAFLALAFPRRVPPVGAAPPQNENILILLSGL